jgi:hypothetical protein
LNTAASAAGLARYLPAVIDALTPDGKADKKKASKETAGFDLGDLGDLAGAAGRSWAARAAQAGLGALGGLWGAWARSAEVKGSLPRPHPFVG